MKCRNINSQMKILQRIEQFLFFIITINSKNISLPETKAFKSFSERRFQVILHDQGSTRFIKFCNRKKRLKTVVWKFHSIFTYLCSYNDLANFPPFFLRKNNVFISLIIVQRLIPAENEHRDSPICRFSLCTRMDVSPSHGSTPKHELCLKIVAENFAEFLDVDRLARLRF